MGMHLKKISFTDQQMEWFNGVADRTGATLAELVRRCVDYYIEDWSKNQPGREHRCASRRAVDGGNND